MAIEDGFSRDNSQRLTWQAVPDAARYELGYIKNGNEIWTGETTTALVAYLVNTPAKIRPSGNYKIRAIASDGRMSAGSNSITLKSACFIKIDMTYTEFNATATMQIQHEAFTTYEQINVVKSSDREGTQDVSSYLIGNITGDGIFTYTISFSRAIGVASYYFTINGYKPPDEPLKYNIIPTTTFQVPAQ